jgi:hypothetical protein
MEALLREHSEEVNNMAGTTQKRFWKYQPFSCNNRVDMYVNGLAICSLVHINIIQGGVSI